LPQLRTDASAVFQLRAPVAAAVWAERGWRFPSTLDRVYVNARARRELGWRPRFDLDAIAQMVATDGTVRTPMTQRVGAKEYIASSYHRGTFHP
jgi:nucleoside-diphosphate-sugar epimerase